MRLGLIFDLATHESVDRRFLERLDVERRFFFGARELPHHDLHGRDNLSSPLFPIGRRLDRLPLSVRVDQERQILMVGVFRLVPQRASRPAFSDRRQQQRHEHGPDQMSHETRLNRWDQMQRGCKGSYHSVEQASSLLVFVWGCAKWAVLRDEGEGEGDGEVRRGWRPRMAAPQDAPPYGLAIAFCSRLCVMRWTRSSGPCGRLQCDHGSMWPGGLERP